MNNKNKNISWTICPYDYTPDYEETYKGVTFTVGLELFGNISATIEFDTPENMYSFLGTSTEEVHKKRTCPNNQDIENIFHTIDLDVFEEPERVKGNTACLLLRLIGECRIPYDSSRASHAFVTPARLEAARRKYRASFKKYSDVLPNYLNQKRYVELNPLCEKVEGLSDEEILDFMKDFGPGLQAQGVTLYYITQDIAIEMCRNLIDKMIRKQETMKKHPALFNALKETFKN